VPKVHRSTVIDAPVEEVWRLLRDFNGHERWHPAVAASRIEDGRAGDEVGAVRRFRLRDGAELREQLLRLSDRDRSFTYCLLESPIPLLGYVATVRLRPVTDGNRTFWDWRSSFAAPPGQEAELAALVSQEIYEAGFAAVRALVAGGRVARPERRPAVAAGATRGPITTRAIVLERHGGPEELRWLRVEVPPPGPGEVRLRQTAVGLNYLDVYSRTGEAALLLPPATPGVEAAGEVVDVGEGVVGILPGDRVAYACLPAGAYAGYRTLRADHVLVLPEEIDDATAAAVLLKGLTAEYLLRRVGRVRSGDTVLVHAAAGATGLLLCQWARALGATVLGAVSTPDKARLARDHGCAYPIVAEEAGLVERVRELTGGRGVSVVYDGVGGATTARSLELLAARGHLVSFGHAAGPAPPLDPGSLSARSATVTCPVLFDYTADPAEERAMARRLFAMVARGAVRAAIGQRYPLAEAARAHRDLEARRTAGQTVLVP
jgi:NADPH:quinone reductase-like Zn-dependent oxidoreductase/uncharacterized protein YndB with AHSA1/START domain